MWRTEPLTKWPEQLQREKGSRSVGPFRVGITKTEPFLERELYMISARNVILRTFHGEKDYRRDGGLRVDARAPIHPGVILEFEKPQLTEQGDIYYVKMRLPCDTYRDWADNLRAIAMVLEGLRMIDRHEVSQGAQYQGYLALPPKPGELTIEEAAAFLAEQGEVAGAESTLLRFRSFAETAYKVAAKRLHPDKGGDAEQFAKLEKSISMIRDQFSANGDAQ